MTNCGKVAISRDYLLHIDFTFLGMNWGGPAAVGQL